MRIHSILMVPLLVAAGCDRKTDPLPASTRPVAAACVSRPEGSRWAGEYAQTAVFGDSEGEELAGITIAGIAAADSQVYVLDSKRAALWLLRPDLQVVRRVGRDGRGPGEWRPFGGASQGGSMRWVSASANGVRMFDGERIQEFRPDGRFRRVFLNGAMRAGVSPMQSRQAFVGDTLLYSAGGYDAMASISTGGPTRREVVDGRNPWWVRMRVGDQERAVLQLRLTPLRKVTLGPAQARPLWDTNGACVVASDGAGPLLVYAPLGGRQDTVTVPLPDRVVQAGDYADKMGGILPPGTRLEQPSAPTRVRDLIVDPDGFVWLLPVQPAAGIPGGVEVVRVPLGGAAVMMDTVPAFPRAFGGPGVYFAETRGPDGEILVARYDRGSSVDPVRGETEP